MATLDRASVSGVPTAELASRAWAGTEGWASSTASKPAWTCWLPAGPSVRSCQPGAFNESGSMEVTRVWVMSWPALSSGSAPAPPRGGRPGAAPQRASRREQPLLALPARLMATWRGGLPETVGGAAGAATGGVASAVLRRSRLAGRGSGLLMGGLSVTVGKRDAIQNQQEPLYTRYHPVGT